MPALAAEWSYIDHSPSSYTSARPTDYVQSKFLTSATNNSAISSGSTSVARNRPDRNDGLPPAKVSLFNEAKLKMKWPEKRVVGAGLINLGNTCFVNSVLQCLSYTVPLSCHLLSGSHKSSCKEVGFCMLCLLQDHVTRSAFHQGDAFKPLKVLQNLRNIAKCLTWGRQEDAHEFLRYVVDSMQKSCLSGLNGLDKYSKETTLVHRIFGGYLRSQVMCMQCRHASNTFDPFLDISVEVKESSNLENALSKFVTPETLDVENAYKCESCMKKVCAQKRFTIHKASNVLTIHLKRFDMNRMLGTKVSRHIKFPSELNIRPYMSVSTGIPVYYSLYGVLVHSGFSCNSGHYYSYIKAPDDSWYCMNDSTVSKTSQSTVLGAEAYILFYGRLENKTVYVNGKAPCTITRYDTKSSCHTSSNGKVMIGPQLPARNFPPKSLICKVNKPAAVVVNTGLQSLVPYPEERDSPEREDASNEMNAPSHKVDKDIMQPAPSSKLNSFSNSSLKFTPRSVEPAAKLKVIPETPAAKSIPDVTTSHLAPIEMVHNDFSQKSDGTTLSTDVVSPSCSNHKTQTVSNGAYRINPKNSFHQNDILSETTLTITLLNMFKVKNMAMAGTMMRMLKS
ncbi:USP42 [Bugula neritina]|uniref:Ubiquitin carboxyl-terminal hydrolase n=1 Tax=Bugula neritina TaxID=10212 RepID=A0A7J7J3W3_BUGNE|nr:USP42 [Bugula neritina]